jgi:uncharacterized peroxidase-related enzyme
MPYITTVPEERADGELGPLYDKLRRQKGYVPNYLRAFSLHPSVYRAWEGLITAVKENMDPRRFELVTLAAARALRSSYCMLAHGAVLAEKFFSPRELAGIAGGTGAGAVTPAEEAMMRFAEKVVRDASSVTLADVDGLRGAGFTDAEVFDIAVAATARCFFSKTLDAVGAQADAAYAALPEPLPAVLTVGRPIEG